MKSIVNHLKENWIRYGFETLVVVVGILGAYSLNNWNENRKDRIREINILNEIRENLIQDIDDHNENMGYLSQVVTSSGIILEHLQNDKPYHDSLAFHFAWLPMAANFDATTSGYELLTSQGTNIISNDDLRGRISGIYRDYRWLRDFLKDRQTHNNQPLFLDMMKKFSSYKHLEEAIPRDYEALKSDQNFMVLVIQNAHIIRMTRQFNEVILGDVRGLIRDIEQEILQLGGAIES